MSEEEVFDAFAVVLGADPEEMRAGSWTRRAGGAYYEAQEADQEARLMDNRYAAICVACVRDRFDGTCDAFRRSIPGEIGHGMADHRRALPRRCGVRFELRESFEETWRGSRRASESSARNRRRRFYVIRGCRSE